MVMCCSATIVRPLRSKRAMISPVRPRAKASGLTRISVLSMASSVSATTTTRSFARGCGLCFGDRLRLGGLGRDRRLIRRLAPATARRGRGRSAGLCLAERADAPRRVDRLRARVAAFLELAHAARTAQVVRLDLVVAMRAERVVQARQACLGSGHLELAQAH